MRIKSRILTSAFAFAIVGMSISASAEEIQIASFRNVVTGVNTNNITANNLSIQQKSGWQNVDGTWYYFKEGIKATGWQNVDGAWYYMDNYGAMLHDATVGGYKLGSSGALVTV